MLTYRRRRPKFASRWRLKLDEPKAEGADFKGTQSKFAVFNFKDSILKVSQVIQRIFLKRKNLRKMILRRFY